MEKKTLKKRLLPLFLMALCIIFIKTPTILSPRTEDIPSSVMPLSDLPFDENNEDD